MPAFTTLSLVVWILSVLSTASSAAHHQGRHQALLTEWRTSIQCHGTVAASAPSPLTARLQGSGAHRWMSYSVDVPAAERAAGCTLTQIHVAQPLPTEIFVDPYQLHGLTRTKAWTSFRTFGPLDLESPATHSEPTVVAAQVDLSMWERQHSSSPPASGAPLAPHEAAASGLVVSIPLHSRYPVPTNETGPSGAWWAGLATGTVHVRTPWPVVLVECATGDWHELGPTPDDMTAGSPQPEELTWEVPAGSMQHAEVVSLGTAIAAAVASVVLLAVLFRDRLAEPQGGSMMGAKQRVE